MEKKYYLISYACKVQGFDWEFKNDKTDKSIPEWLKNKKQQNMNMIIIFISAIPMKKADYDELDTNLII